MPVLYFPEVAEYAPFIAALGGQAGVELRRAGGYVAAGSDHEIAIARGATGLGEAVWFGALVGGFAGRILQFDDQHLRVGD